MGSVPDVSNFLRKGMLQFCGRPSFHYLLQDCGMPSCRSKEQVVGVQLSLVFSKGLHVPVLLPTMCILLSVKLIIRFMRCDYWFRVEVNRVNEEEKDHCDSREAGSLEGI